MNGLGFQTPSLTSLWVIVESRDGSEIPVTELDQANCVIDRTGTGVSRHVQLPLGVAERILDIDSQNADLRSIGCRGLDAMLGPPVECRGLETEVIDPAAVVYHIVRPVMRRQGTSLCFRRFRT